MEAKDLRIGNYVYIQNELLPEVKNKAFKISAISLRFDRDFPNSDSVIGLDLLSSIRIYNQFIEFIKPIPLIEKWLLDFGFENGNICYKNAYSIDVLKTDFYLRPSYRGGFYWGFNISDEKLDCELNDVKPLKYVHELQNLYFAITGLELTKNSNI